MYQQFFRLQKRPFSSAPQADVYFPAHAIEGTRQCLVRCIERAEGIGVVAGGTGTGKTLLLQLLARQFHDTFTVVTLANGHLDTRRDLLQAILFEMHLPYRGLDEGELRLSLLDAVSAPAKPKSKSKSNQGMLLLVDEAHTLPGKLLEELRLITNLVRGGEPRVRLVLAGGPTLEERLAHPRLTALSQRVSARGYLQPLTHGETREYIRALISLAGG